MVVRYLVQGYGYIIGVLLIYNMGFAIIKRALTYAYIVHSAEIVSSTDRIITEQSSCRR